MLKEFKTFLMRGNVLDLAVGVIIGGAFGAITTSLVDDIISPVLGIFTGQVNFGALTFELGLPMFDTKAVITYGNFLNALINFLIMSFVVFLIVKAVNKMMSMGKKEEAAADPTTKECPYCFSEININATRCPHCTSELEEKK
ncbi:MAG: large conductance mechanosensitive channel protein MscL [Firmicutes bacterium]|nr:large conductance mechanosensitive channel protein MscL [Bacillota bacterium]